jgi:hypothetical protein
MKVTIPNSELQVLSAGQTYQYPKYTTQLINLANQNAQGTRPRVVGQMTELINEFDGKLFEEWEMWYKDQYPDAIERATDRIYPMLMQLKEAIQQVDRDLVKKWVEELILVKTFTGLKFQEPILKKVAELKNSPYRFSSTKEEAKGIDGYIGDTPVSIKPHTYQSMQGLSEQIAVVMIYYTKTRDSLVIEFDF